MRKMSRSRRTLSRFALSGLAGLTVVAFVATAANAFASTSRAEATGAAAKIVRLGIAARLPIGATETGAVSSSQHVSAVMVLKPNDSAGLATYASAVTTPGSSLYRHYLSRTAFATSFAPTQSSVSEAEASLRSSGLMTEPAQDHGLIIPFAGTASEVEKAFHTSLVGVRLPGGRIGRSATSAPAVPARIAGTVAAVEGLDDISNAPGYGSFAIRLPGTASAAAAAARLSGTASQSVGGPHACAAASKFAQLVNGYTEDQVAHAYGTDNLYKSGNMGSGQTVDIFELEPFATSDVAAFDTCYFGVSHADLIRRVSVDGGAGSGPGSGEAALDVEEVSALAPAAKLDVYEAPQNFASWLDEEAAIVGDDNASVVSTSWGVCEDEFAQLSPGFQQVENVLFQQAAIEGQGWFAASGDSGSEGCSRNNPANTDLTVSDPATQPYVTGVGGTSLLAPSDPPTEVVWNDGGVPGGSTGGGGGGGISKLWQMPSWQSGLAVSGVRNRYSSNAPCGAASGVYCREVPDVSASADEDHGDTVFFDGAWTAFGGTSVAAPKWAAIAALSDNLCSSEDLGPIGFANPDLYRIASSAGTYSEAFNDVTHGDNDVLGAHSGAYPATTDYDLATGLGTPKVTGADGKAGLASLLCADGSSLSPRPALSGVSPDFGPYTGGTKVTIDGSDLSSVTSVSFGSKSVKVSAGQINRAGTVISGVTTPPSPVDPNPPIGPVGGVAVTAAGPAGASLPTPSAEFHFVKETRSGTIPQVSYVGPSAGETAGGERVLIVGSGFDEEPHNVVAPTVSFGGVSGTHVTIVSDAELSVTVPPESPATDCATASATPPVSRATICQVEVTVSNGYGTSPTASILPAPTGSLLAAAPPHTELVAAATEFDYAPPPTTTAVEPTSLPESVNEFGFPPTVTISGTGFNFLTFQQVTFGPAGAPYATADAEVTSVEPNELQLYYLGLDRTASITKMPVTVQSVGGESNPQSVAIARTPKLSAISKHSGPTTGGTTVTASGSGFTAGDSVEFVVAADPIPESSTNDVKVESPTELAFTAPAATAGSGSFEVCDSGECSSATGPSVAFTYFEPVKPYISSFSPTSRPATGGGEMTIIGTGLGSVQSVYFGSVRSPLAVNPPTFMGPSDTEIQAKIPPGIADTRVKIRVITLAGSAVSSKTFSYPYP